MPPGTNEYQKSQKTSLYLESLNVEYIEAMKGQVLDASICKDFSLKTFFCCSAATTSYFDNFWNKNNWYAILRILSAKIRNEG